jgi:anti-anti-sigma factor
MGSWLDIGARGSTPRRRGRGVIDVALHGPLNMLTVAEQEQRVFALVTESQDDVLLDLSHVTRVSAVGIQMVLYVRAVLAHAGRQLMIVGTHPELDRRLQELGMDLLIPVFPTRKLALSAR